MTIIHSPISQKLVSNYRTFCNRKPWFCPQRPIHTKGGINPPARIYLTVTRASNSF